jgi:hypothetical protein
MREAERRGGRSGQRAIAAAPSLSETPSAEHTTSPNAPTPTQERPLPIGGDEITVDSYVMRPEVRGTNRDPRALNAEQWLVKVRMIDSGRTFNVRRIRGSSISSKKATGSTSGIASGNTRELFGARRSLARKKKGLALKTPNAERPTPNAKLKR